MLKASHRLFSYETTGESFRFLGVLDGAVYSISTEDTTPSVSVFEPVGWAATSMTVDPDGANGGPYGPYSAGGSDANGNQLFQVTDSLDLGVMVVRITGTDADSNAAILNSSINVYEPVLTGFSSGFSNGFG